MAIDSEAVLGSFLGDDAFPVEWDEGERELLWVLDDLHCPNPVSPMFFDIGGWWLTCDHMFRRFGTPFASDWLAKNVNGYVYTAAVAGRRRGRVESSEYQARYVPGCRGDPEYAADRRLPRRRAAALRRELPRLVARPAAARDRAQLRLSRRALDRTSPSLVELAVLLEDAIDIHDRHWKIHWMLNFAQFSATMALNATIAEVKGEVDPALVGRLQSSVEDRNWDSIEALWQMKEEVKGDASSRARSPARPRSGACAAGGLRRGRRFIAERLEPHPRSSVNKAIWSHEFVYPTWRENPAPIVEAVRGYLEADYDFPATLAAVAGRPRGGQARAAGRCARGRGAGRARAGARALAAHEPAHAGPPLLHRPGHERPAAARARRDRSKPRRGGRARRPRGRDVPALQRAARAHRRSPTAVDARSLVGDRRDERERSFAVRPPEWIGTATREQLAFPYLHPLGLSREVPPRAAPSRQT